MSEKNKLTGSFHRQRCLIPFKFEYNKTRFIYRGRKQTKLARKSRVRGEEGSLAWVTLRSIEYRNAYRRIEMLKKNNHFAHCF